VLGLVLPWTKLQAITLDFLNLKRRWYPRALPVGTPFLDWVLHEVKGGDLRKTIREGTHNIRHAIGFLNGCVKLIEAHEARLVGRVWIKKPGDPFNARSIYTSSIQAMATYFHRCLADRDDIGVMILDSRSPRQNAQVAHSIFTQKFRTAGDRYIRLAEMPTFGHSENHAGLQLVDIIASALVLPIACYVFCTGAVVNRYLVVSEFGVLRVRFGARLRALQYRYQEPDGRWSGGIVVSDAIAGKPGGLLFGPT
jgi:uncharacterized protein DUF3800